ncbi:hypothetical protein BO83DRAFT_327498 [Aspergillus eucalypticola CBS 122712]|uniref:Reverse transcriptase domain-containing protein n=1 Tax=Aspergillus eucalypticola (strain CBS 122712 / IBT 29274) TaxID=1448314 RepID=A0A317UKP6_ASPEC|nr:uncharacterized protein BO83DRAFT_327498 [Aspergillus eucalypticola CBS 122712]PWY61688.1 hypothetical protein BO83DRAFT_327498 [Aspergillus eucalypticola CBS 122712]
MLIYINNIIIYSHNINKYLRHLDTVLNILKINRIILSLSKYYFIYPFIKLLSHYISCLSITMTDDKVTAIHHIYFLTTVRELETNIIFFNYYQCFVDVRAEPPVRCDPAGHVSNTRSRITWIW